MSSTGCPSEAELRAFQMGDLAESALDRLARHLESCPKCEARAQQFDTDVDSVLSALRESTTPPPASSAHDSVTAIVSNGPIGRQPSTDYSFLRPPVQPDEIGRLAHYRVLRLLAKGGMAYIFHAEDLRLGRPVALKIMKPELGERPDGCQRFLREARIMAAIKHDNVVPVYDVNQEGSAVYLSMELLEGESLGARLDRVGPGRVTEIVRIARKIARGLGVVHRNGLIHSDLTPGNIWLEAPGDRVKILDFGLARFTHDDTNVTMLGTVMGTPAFMSPEQARGENVDARSDLFSLGCVLYLLCTGTKAFSTPNTSAFLVALAISDPRPVRELNPAIPPALADLVTQLLQKRPEQRPASAEAVVERLQQIEADLTDVTLVPRPAALRPVPGWRTRLAEIVRRRPARALGLAIVAIVLVLGGWLAATRWAGPRTASMSPALPDAVYLNDLDIVGAEQWPFTEILPGPPEPEFGDGPPPLGGHAVMVRGRWSPHGVWMHLPPPPRQATSVSFSLGKRFTVFQTDVSLNDGPRQCTPMTFAVYGDGQRLWTSRPVSSQADTQTSPELSVLGVEVLTLEVTCFGFEAGTHAVWIEPHLKR